MVGADEKTAVPPPEAQAEIDRLAALTDEELLGEIPRLRNDVETWAKIYGLGLYHPITQADLVFAEVLERWMEDGGWIENRQEARERRGLNGNHDRRRP